LNYSFLRCMSVYVQMIVYIEIRGDMLGIIFFLFGLSFFQTDIICTL
jgi:hypothetical protein